jgi:hypothetical protein
LKSQNKGIKQEAIDSLLLLPKEEKVKVMEFIDGLVDLEQHKHNEQGITSKSS